MFEYPFMVSAFEAGTAVAAVAGVIGYFVVLRGTAFAAHALAHIGFAGAAGAVVLGLNPVFGLLAFTLGSGTAIGALGNRLRGRDVTIGIVLAWTLGLGVLFISLYRGYATEAYAILFGEILGISAQDVAVTVAGGVVTLLAVAAIYRPLLFSSVDEAVAAARGVPVTALAVGFMAVLAVAVTEAVQVVGVLLIFALLVAPAAIACRLTSRPGLAILVSVGLALVFTWAGLGIGFFSPHPVSFFITTLAFGAYLAVRLAGRLAGMAEIRGGGAEVVGDTRPMKLLIQILLAIFLHPVAFILVLINLARRQDLTGFEKLVWAIVCLVWGVGPIIYVLAGRGSMW
jgi:zinc/manganese transport system permease protein